MQVTHLLGLTLLGILAGVSFVMQSAVNTQLRESLASLSWAVFFSYLGGTLVMGLVLAATRTALPAAATLPQTPWIAWTGGLFGVVYVMSLVVLLPRIGSVAALALLVAGQMLAALVFDQFGWFGIAQQAVTPTKVLGALLLVAGVVLVRA
ncbi:DMT family transporter [Luteimonas sp. BDR2-5]|uniref:DMT family transporter n=1 Tax=Proluteimonas luteida TaxID=2878685 RepID=UPI001E4D3525|nr:DMT family transporter [Luteimonas sp. BDR2-5]MCD9028435.1 DMT family transporter [Luteimonas sp. BDR2-5]